MTIQKLPLAERLERIKNGLSPYPGIAIEAVRAMAQIPITTYLQDFDEELSQLPCLLNVPAYKSDKMTYEQAATAIYLRRLAVGSTQHVCRAAEMLAAPFVKYCKEKAEREKNDDG